MAHKIKKLPFRNFATGNLTGLIELREYKLFPHLALPFSNLVNNLNFSSLPLRSFTLPESGGILNMATHTYFYENHDHRMAQINAQSQRYIDVVGPYIQEAKSTLWVEAPLVKSFGLHSMQSDVSPGNDSNSVIYEVRRYQLKLGYSTVPQFCDLYARGLPSKLTAPGSDPSTSLITVIYTETGSLNEVIELWRHGRGNAAMNQSRQAARNASEWRSSIAQIAELAVSFTSTNHRPLPCSPWQ